MKYLRTESAARRVRAEGDEDPISLAAIKRNVSCVKNHIYLFDEIDEETQLLVESYIQSAYTYLMTASAESLAATGSVAEPIYLHINSPGGLVTSSLALYDYIRNFKIPIVGIVEGMACSGASIILCGCLTREMSENSVILCHELRGASYGKYSQLKDEAFNNDIFMEVIKKIYATETNLPSSVLDELLSHDIYWTADIALKYGLVDAVLGRPLDEDYLSDVVDTRITNREKEDASHESPVSKKAKPAKAKGKAPAKKAKTVRKPRAEKAAAEE